MSISFISFSQINEKQITKKEINEVIDSIKESLNVNYINKELSVKMVKLIHQNIKKEEYNSIKDYKQFANKLTEDLQSISNDPHLKVNFEPERIANKKALFTKSDSIKLSDNKLNDMKRTNFGFSEVKIFDGNIGYLDLRYFSEVELATETLDATMSFLGNTSAIILDLRFNGGGDPSMVQLLASYFFNDDPVLLNTFYCRSTNESQELWTKKTTNGKHLPYVLLYVLTSKNTFSAAEAFAYDLKHLSRATVIGETTKGGANLSRRFSVNSNFTISIPYMEAIHPVTKTNWESVGVIPDINSESNDAFIIAYIDALNKILGDNPFKNKLINKMGYGCLHEDNINKAIQFFEANTKLFPNDANVWDSLGEAFLKSGDENNALISYKKAIEINPEMTSAKEMIKKIIKN